MPLRFIDNATFTSRVGIGTNNPTSPLHVFNAGYPQMALQSNTGTWQVGVSTGNDLAFRRGTSGSNYPLWLDSSDNVGIGTTSPLYKLDVSGNIRVDSTGVAQMFLDSAASNDAVLNFHENAAQKGKIGYDTSLSGIALVAGSGAFSSADMVVLDTGNVGIGTTSPAQKLHINGNFLLENNNEIRQKDSGGTQRTIIELDSSNDLNIGGSYAGALKFIGGGSYAEVMRIHDNGNVGIGTTSPGVKLDVAGQIRASSGLEISGGNINLIDNSRIRLGSSADLQIYHDGSNSYIADTGTGDLYIRGSNSVYIGNNAGTKTYISGTDGGATKLYYNGAGVQQKLETTSTGVSVTGTATATTFSGDLNGTINTATTAVTKANATNDTTVATTAFVQNLIGTIPAGLVFQGTWDAATNTPTLTSGSGTTGHFYIVSTDGSTNLDGITDWKVGDWAVFVEQGATDAWEKVDNSSVLDGSGTGQKVALWSGSGTSNTLTDAPITVSGNNVGIGTSSPSSKLHIKQSADSIDGGLTWESVDGTQEWSIDANNAGNFRIYKGTTAIARFDSSGNLGIGTTSPSAKLTVKGAGTTSATTALLVQNSATTELFRVRDDGSVYGIGAGGVDTNAAYGKDALISNTTGANLVALGYRALYNNTTGLNNTALGHMSLFDNTTGSSNVAIGTSALENNTASRNTAVGYAAMFVNTTGTFNVAMGYHALLNNTANLNTAVGYEALKDNTSGQQSVALGSYALANNTTAGFNTAVGGSAMFINTTGTGNVALGYQSLYENTTADDNTAIGSLALRNNTIGVRNTAVGRQALNLNTTGNFNTALGRTSLYLNTTGSYNTAVGYDSLRNNTASNLTAVGFEALKSNTTGYANVALGDRALRDNTTGNSNIAIGQLTLGVNTGSNNTAVGSNAMFSNTSGASNVALGTESLRENTTGTSNVAIGRRALRQNTASNNTAVGYLALFSNTTGTSNVGVGTSTLENNTASNNTAVGYNALHNNTTGTQNVALGGTSLRDNTTGGFNTAIGFESLKFATNSAFNTAVGHNSLQNNNGNNNTAVGRSASQQNTTGVNNVAMGYLALNNNNGNTNTAIGHEAAQLGSAQANVVAIGGSSLRNNTASNNVAVGTSASFLNTAGTNITSLGYRANYSNTTASNNTAIGARVLENSTGGQNTGIGSFTLFSNTTASYNTAVGHEALRNNTTGANNTASGRQALYSNTTGSNNVALGYQAGYETGNLTGTSNTFLGYNASYGTATTITNSTAVGANVTLTDSNTVILGNNANVGIGTTGPSAKLHVQTTSGVTARFAYDSNNYQDLNWEGSNIVGGSHTFKIAGSEKMRIDSAGNVGIGTTSPGYSIDVNNAASEAIARFYRSDSATSISHLVSTGRPQTRYAYSGYQTWFLGNNLGTFGIGTGYLASTTPIFNITSSGNVGIGTSSPTTPLHVAGITQIVESGNTAFYGGDYVRLFGSQAFKFRNAASSTIAQINLSGDSYFNGGNVGIGTTSPDSLVEIDSTPASQSQTRMLHLDNNPGSNQGSGYLEISSGTNSQAKTQIEQVSSGGFGLLGNQYIDTNIINRGLSSSAHGNINFATGSSSSSTSIVMTIGGGSQKGNVGIGTTSPGSKLHVQGTSFFFDQAIFDDKVGIGTTSPSEKLYVAGSIGVNTGQSLKWGSGATRIVGIDGSYIAMYPNNSEKVRFLSNGNVLIGTTIDNGDKLTVAGAISTTHTGYTTDAFKVTHNSNDVLLSLYRRTDQSTPQALIRTGGVSYFNGGNVGIGTTSPSHKLDIYSNENVPLRVHRPSNANLNQDGAWGIGFSTRGDAATSTSDTRAGIFSYYNGNLFLAAANTSIVADPIDYARLTVLNTGSVGIGTTSPDSRLEVDMGDASGNRLGFTGDGSTTGAALWTNWTTGASYLDFRLGGTTDTYTKMRIDSSGNVGIGTTSPDVKLHVSGNAKATNIYVADSIIHTGDTNNYFKFDTDTQIFATSGAERMRINSSGNVGIGTTGPVAPLDVNGNIQITGVGNTLIFDNSSVKWQQYVNGNEFTLRYNGGVWSERLRVDTDGNVGISTTNPTEKLDVNGTVKSTGLYVTSAPRIDAGGGSQPGPTPFQSPSDAIVKAGGDTAIYLSEPDEWLVVNISGVDYVIPAYL